MFENYCVKNEYIDISKSQFNNFANNVLQNLNFKKIIKSKNTGYQFNDENNIY